MHVGVVMDGSGRWAAERGLPRSEGHRAGVGSARRVIAAAPALGIDTLTLFAFTCGNWARPPEEVAGIFDLLERFLLEERARWAAEGTRVRVIGRRDRITQGLRRSAAEAEAATAAGGGLRVRIAVDYSARGAVVLAVRRALLCRTVAADLSEETFSRILSEAVNDGDPASDVDLLIRTGGEWRLSDCLLWDGAYAELCFSPVLWPDFGESDLAAAVSDFRSRDRRFGGLKAAAAL